MLVATRIMIVDDDRDLLEELAEVLASAGYEPIVVANSGDAAVVAREKRPDVVLLDLKMPAKDGFSVALELTRMPETCRIPIIGMTGVYNGPLWANLMSLCGFDSYLLKPVDPAKLFAQIENALAGKVDEHSRSPASAPREENDTHRPDSA